MIKWIMHWFRREPKLQPGWSLRMKMLMYRHRYLRFIKDDNIFKVNQDLTGLLLNEEQIFLSNFQSDNDLAIKRHKLVAQQLEELRTLRSEIKEVYKDLD